MRLPVILAALLLAGSLAFIGWRNTDAPEVISEPKATPPEAAPLCPWREPQTDLKSFFPEATGYQLETRILSGMRLQLAEKLGRMPTGDENALHLYRVRHNDTLLGTILTARVKGEYGAIELVLATDTNRAVRGMRLQRLREPQPIANVLLGTTWQSQFLNKRAEDPWTRGKDIPEVPAQAQRSAAAVLDGVRSLLILLGAADTSPVPTVAEAHHH